MTETTEQLTSLLQSSLAMKKSSTLQANNHSATPLHNTPSIPVSSQMSTHRSIRGGTSAHYPSAESAVPVLLDFPDLGSEDEEEEGMADESSDHSEVDAVL